MIEKRSDFQKPKQFSFQSRAININTHKKMVIAFELPASFI